MGLLRERSVAVVEANRDPEAAESVLCRWIGQAIATSACVLQGNGQQRADLTQIAALKKQVARLWTEREFLTSHFGPQPARVRWRRALVRCWQRVCSMALCALQRCNLLNPLTCRVLWHLDTEFFIETDCRFASVKMLLEP